MLEAITRENAERIATILAEHGWPGWRLVGVEGAQAAWLLVQHADHDLALQKRCLAALDNAVKAHDADPEHWAYLVDRVAVAEKRPQVFGTQFTEARQPHSIEDEANVDTRRASVGLEPLEAYRSRMWQMYGPPTR